MRKKWDGIDSLLKLRSFLEFITPDYEKMFTTTAVPVTPTTRPTMLTQRIATTPWDEEAIDGSGDIVIDIEETEEPITTGKPVVTSAAATTTTTTTPKTTTTTTTKRT